MISATIGGTAIDQADTVTVSAGALSTAVSTLVASPDALTAGAGSSTITVTALDANGNPIAGVRVPVDPEIYEPVLRELEGLGIRFAEARA